MNFLQIAARIVDEIIARVRTGGGDAMDPRKKLLDAWDEYESNFSSWEEALWEITSFAHDYANENPESGMSPQEIEEAIYEAHEAA